MDDFENVISKNFNTYAQSEDFSFASSRSKDELEKIFNEFAKKDLSGAFQVKDWFNSGVLPKIVFM